MPINKTKLSQKELADLAIKQMEARSRGGIARAKKLSKNRRIEIALMGVAARKAKSTITNSNNS